MRWRRMSGEIVALLLLTAIAVPAVAETVAPTLRDTIEDTMSTNFVRPQTTIWRFDAMKPYLGDEQVVCGWVNYESAAQKYLGFHQFYAIVSNGAVTLSQIGDPTQDPSGKLAEKLKALCD